MMLGKRKRDTQVVSRRKVDAVESESTAKPITNTNEIFRQYFEAQFAPLPEQQNSDISSRDEHESEAEDSASEDGSETSEWSGISDATRSQPVAVVEVNVIDHSSKLPEEDDEFHRARQKAFMVRYTYNLSEHMR